MKQYIAFVHKDHGSDYGVSFPDFPGCVTAGRTLEEAQRKAPEALSLHIAGMIEDGEKLPKPSTIDDAVRDPASRGAVVAIVVPARTERAVNTVIDKIKTLARRAGLPLPHYAFAARVVSKSSRVKHTKFLSLAKKAKRKKARAEGKARLRVIP
jgi:predicted RNase H-like HicB family nuclease